MQDLKQRIVEFWFVETPSQYWFQSTPEIDQQVKDEFIEAYGDALNGKFESWEHDADGALALCILLDQFPRMMFRGQPKAFGTDKQALLIAKKAIHMGLDKILSVEKRRFLYIPFMHSENLGDQKRSVELFEAMKDEDPLGYKHALRHYEEIEKFSRFPYRNEALSRTSTPEEEAYLSSL